MNRIKEIIFIAVINSLLIISCDNSCKTNVEFNAFYFNMLDTIKSYGKQFNTEGEVVFLEERCKRFSDYTDYLKLLTNHEFRYTIIEAPVYENQTFLEYDVRDLENWYEENKCWITKEKADSIVEARTPTSIK